MPPVRELAKSTEAMPASAESAIPVEERARSKQASAGQSSSAASGPTAASTGKMIPDHYSILDSKRSTFLIKGMAVAALLVLLCLYPLLSDRFKKLREAQDADSASPDYSPMENLRSSLEAKRISEKLPDMVPIAGNAVREVGTSLGSSKDASVSAPEVLPIDAKSKDKPAEEHNASDVAVLTAALDAAKKVADEAEKGRQDMLTKKQQAEAAASDAKKGLGEKTATAAPILKAADEVTTLKAKREEEMRAANLAANEAKKMAEEKSRLADEAKKAVANLEKDSKERFAARQKIEAELKQLQETVGEKERLAAEARKNLEAAEAKREQYRVSVQKSEEQLTRAKAAVEEAQKIALARQKEQEEKREEIRKEMERAKREFDERMKALESALQPPEEKAASSRANSPTGTAPAPTKPVRQPSRKPESKTPAESAKPQAGDAQKPTETGPIVLVAANVAAPKPAPAPDAQPNPPHELTNSLGMRFAPVGDLLFSIWPTRVSDFETFASATGLKSTLWREPSFPQQPDHPVVNVTWMEAVAFCKWLTFKEQREGTLPAQKVYRLPTDLEWSKAVGLPEETGKTPELRDMVVRDVYPWGTQWPPPPGAGNYTGEETGLEVGIPGYNDGFPWTSPVGRFQPNKYGLYDMGGNVWQWVADAWSSDSRSKVLRGASWYNGAVKVSLLSSCRVHAAKDSCTDNYGFRCVLGMEIANSSMR
jgi:hypothetical protein